jgi:hypothetical protein
LEGERLGIVEMRRHYTNYFKGIANFKEYRLKLVTISPEELFKALDEIQEIYSDYQVLILQYFLTVHEFSLILCAGFHKFF